MLSNSFFSELDNFKIHFPDMFSKIFSLLFSNKNFTPPGNNFFENIDSLFSISVNFAIKSDLCFASANVFKFFDTDK